MEHLRRITLSYVPSCWVMFGYDASSCVLIIQTLHSNMFVMCFYHYYYYYYYCYCYYYFSIYIYIHTYTYIYIYIYIYLCIFICLAQGIPPDIEEIGREHAGVHTPPLPKDLLLFTACSALGPELSAPGQQTHYYLQHVLLLAGRFDAIYSSFCTWPADLLTCSAPGHQMWYYLQQFLHLASRFAWMDIWLV